MFLFGMKCFTNEDFFNDYINRWQDLANTDLSCANMIDVLDSMVFVIDPEMLTNRYMGRYIYRGSLMFKMSVILS